MRLEELKDFLISLGVKGWRLFTIFPVGRAAKDPELQLSNEEFRGVMEFIRKSRKEGRIHVSYGCEGFLGNYEAEVRDTFFACRAGISVGSVFVPIITREIFMRMILWKYGIIDSNLTVTENG